ncbi:hypothetical protein Taro_031527 [Colocasia esculenta]|uniref:Uncharacterized protein n=1 Tax=Colocasia esculenta TaxID=4460 RepID=A0A843W6P3_COLES|nr:hypothetical protein [Colocasia esculenta]
MCVPLRSVSSVLDTLTPMLELYVRLSERRQRAATCESLCLVACNALVVGGTDTNSRHWSLASLVFQCLTLGSLVSYLEVRASTVRYWKTTTK